MSQAAEAGVLCEAGSRSRAARLGATGVLSDGPEPVGPGGWKTDVLSSGMIETDRCAELSMPTGREVTESGQDPEKGLGEALIVLSSLSRKPRSTFHCFIFSSV